MSPWLTDITSHIPNKGTQNLHYFGHIVTNPEGFKKIRKMSKDEIIIADTTPTKKSCSKKCASLIKKYTRWLSLMSSMFSSIENNFNNRDHKLDGKF